MTVNKPHTKQLPKQKLIVYIAQHHVDILIENAAQVIRMDYPNTLVRDMEVINKEALQAQIRSLIENQKIPHGIVLVVLSSAVVFEKDFPTGTMDETNPEIEKFLENIPFETISSQKVKLKKGVRVIAANRELYESITEVLKELTFSTQAIIPYFTVVEKVEELKNGLTPQLGKKIFSRFMALKQHNMVAIHDNLDENKYYEDEATLSILVKDKRVRMLTLGGTFGTLLFVLAFMVVTMVLPPPKPKAPPLIIPIPTQIPEPSPEPTPELPSTEAAKLERQKYIVKIQNGSGISGQAELVKKLLVNEGYVDFKTGNAGSSVTKTLVIFKSTVSPYVRETLIQQLETLFSEVGTQENDSADTDIVITTGKPIPPTPTPPKN